MLIYHVLVFYFPNLILCIERSSVECDTMLYCKDTFYIVTDLIEWTVFTYPLTITYHVFDAINLKSVIFIMLVVLLQTIVILFVKGVRLIK
mgnify:FL=1